MPSQTDHYQKADKNSNFAKALQPIDSTVIGWSLVVLFYSALHYVEAFNAKHNTRFANHIERNADICRNPQLSKIYRDYMDLMNFSWNARYQCAHFTRQELAEALAAHSAIESRIANLL